MKNNFLKIGIKASSLSGKIVSSFFKKYNSFYLKNKNYRDLVSDVDILVEDKIKEVIRKNFPTHQFEGEETGIKKTNSKYKWIIDPIDGTVNYIHGIPLFSISIALEYGGEIILGIINNPITNEIFYASKNEGAYLNGESIRVSNRKKLKEALFIATFSAEKRISRKNKYQIFGKINDISRGCLRIGSASLGLAYLASGKIDGLWGGTLKKWDVAAGIIILLESGGKITTTTNKKYTFGKTFVATNKLIHNELLKLLKKL